MTQKATISRREFLKGGLATLGFVALPGGFLFAAPLGWKHGGKPNLVFGVVSDTHLRTATDGKYSTRYWSDKWFVSALRLFRDAKVDAVLHCGDMAHCGQVEEMEFHRTAWNKVFPHDLAPDGHKVERLFVTGNHDMEALNYGIGKMVIDLYPDPEERARHVLATDIAANWERIWGEPYSDVWHRTVNGYHFFGRHYVPGKGEEVEAQAAALVKETMGEMPACGKPFFLFSHIRPRKVLNAAMREYSNAVSFFGHWHSSAANWNRIYMWSAGPVIQCPSCAPHGSNALSSKDDAWSPNPPIEKSPETEGNRQCYVVRVYDDMLAIERHEVGKGGRLGADWIMPLGRYDPHPFSKDELKKVIGEPQFKRGAALEICNCGNVKLCNYENMEMKEISQSHNSTISQSHNLTIKIPLADGNPDSRVYAYEVEVTGDEGTPKLCKAIYAAGVNMGIGHEPNGGVTTLEIPKSELPSGKTLTVAARPFTSLGTSGRPIITDFKV